MSGNCVERRRRRSSTSTRPTARGNTAGRIWPHSRATFMPTATLDSVIQTWSDHRNCVLESCAPWLLRCLRLEWVADRQGGTRRRHAAHSTGCDPARRYSLDLGEADNDPRGPQGSPEPTLTSFCVAEADAKGPCHFKDLGGLTCNLGLQGQMRPMLAGQEGATC